MTESELSALFAEREKIMSEIASTAQTLETSDGVKWRFCLPSDFAFEAELEAFIEHIRNSEEGRVFLRDQFILNMVGRFQLLSDYV